jgi:hypothetical protein
MIAPVLTFHLQLAPLTSAPSSIFWRNIRHSENMRKGLIKGKVVLALRDAGIDVAFSSGATEVVLGGTPCGLAICGYACPRDVRAS